MSDHQILPVFNRYGVDPLVSSSYSPDHNTLIINMENDLTTLEQRVEALITTCRRLLDDNEGLRSNRDILIEEKSQLAEKNRIACKRLESIAERLQSLERQT